MHDLEHLLALMGRETAREHLGTLFRERERTPRCPTSRAPRHVRARERAQPPRGLLATPCSGEALAIELIERIRAMLTDSVDGP